MVRETETSKTGTDQPKDGQQAEDKTTDQKKSGSDTAKDGFEQLRQHHRKLRALTAEAAAITDSGSAPDLNRRLAQAWMAHADAHDALYEAAIGSGLAEFALLNDVAIETDLVSILLDRVNRSPLEGQLEMAAARVAGRMIGQIIEREEEPRSGLLAKAQAAGVDPAALSGRIGASNGPASGRDEGSTPQTRHLTAHQEEQMARNTNMPDRDGRGRFVSDDHDGGGRGSYGGRGASRYDDDRDNRDRDSRGRFTSDHDQGRGRSSDRDDDRRYGQGRDDDRGGAYSRQSRHDDDRRSYSSGRDDDDRDRGQGGWFGDSQGHAEAARRGWDNRRDDDDNRGYSSRGGSSGRDDDRGGYSRQSRYDDDRRSSGRDRYDDDRDRGQQGWFGDSQGHAEAARRGWDNRRDDDDDRYSSRGRSSGRDDDDDRRYGGRNRR